MDGPSRNGGCRQSRRSRSQRDRERRRRRDLAERRASSPSSASDQEICRGDSLLGVAGGECRPGFPGVRHRPPRRRKRESVSCEEDIIDGFAIASFISLEALEMDSSLKPPERAGGLMGRGSKRKRGPEENGGGPLSEPEEGPPASFNTSSWDKYRKGERKRKRKREEKASGNHFVETGYICDTESDSGDKASDNDMDPIFFVKKVDPVPSSMASSVANGCPLVPTHSGVPRLAVTPRVSGLERSQERSLDLPYPEPLSTSTSSSLSCLPPSHSMSTITVSSLAEQINGLHHRPQERGASSPRPKQKSFLTFPSRPTSNAYSMGVNNSRNGTSIKPPSSSTASSSSMRPPTPSINVPMSHSRGPGAPGPHRPPSRPSSRTYSPGLPPPPPLLQVSSHSVADQDRLRQELNSQYLPSQGTERDGRSSAPSSSSSTGPSVSNATSSTTTRPSQAQPSIPPMSYQFHQHNHQHQHTHTHQHFLHPTATAPPLFEKYPGPKMESLFRHPAVRIHSHRPVQQYFQQYPPQVPGIQPVLPPTGPFSSLQGAFQPKGAAPEMTARLGVIPPHLQPKDPRLTDPFAASLKVSNKPGKWCAMHVRVAWMILRHQEKVKLMQADPHKLDFRNDLLTRLPGSGGMSGLGGLGVLGGPLPPTHDLTRPGGLFAANGGVNPTSSPFIPPSAAHPSFLTSAAHLDPYGRSPPFTPLGALGSGAFGGLGSPTLASSVFGHKDSATGPTVGGMGNPHDPWNRLHVAPPSFPSGPPWAKAGEKRDERERAKEPERREVPHIKDERDRDNMLYGRPPMRMSPGAPAIKQQHRSSTPISHINGLGASLSGGGGPSEGPSRDRERDRERERDRDMDKRTLHSSMPPSRPLAATASSSAPDRPRSSSSSVLTTPPPPSTSLASSPLDLFPRHAPPQLPHSVGGPEPHHSSQRDSVGPASSSSSTSSTVTSHHIKKTERTTPVSKPPPNLPAGLLLPPVKVKEERKEEPLPPHGYDRPSSRHQHHPSTPSSSRSLTPTPGVPLPPLTPHHHPSLLDRSRAAALEAYLGGAAGERFMAHHQHLQHQGHLQPPHAFPWDQWRELAAQQQQQQQRREMALRTDPHLALRTDPHLSRLLQHQQQAQRIMEAERAVAVAAAAAAAANPHHNPRVATPPTSAASSSGRPDFGLMSHHFDRPPQMGGPGGGLLDEEQRSQILREDFERARFSSMHPHAHLSNPHLPSPSHAFHLEQLHAGLLSHPHLHGPGASTSPHHLGLYSRLGPLHQSHIPNGILTKTPAGLVGAPPPLIPSVTSRANTPPRPSRLGAVAELALFSAHKDAESR
ncbi:autism susceptibility gene 2 protein isoform X3 [Alosa sapidissima]|uniref:autism susceptibility gene 2 protein isoform X3 n=1 Tax=Alosa sapidissima TaxID=34773 RepID=UPI001C09721D|nr:autism susceptibility gene 2 protein isoform X3 [Alosa sapidissima]